MRPLRLLLLAAGLAAPAGARAADPVTVELTETVTVGKAVVTVGDIALISGGDATVRDRVARTDIADLKARDASAIVGRRTVEYRLLLAGFDPAAVRVTGAERTTATAARRAVTVEEVAAAVRAELLRHFAAPADTVVELAVPIAVKMPEVLVDERVTVASRPRGKPVAAGRVQMDTTLSAAGETLLSFPVHLNLRQMGPLGAGAPVAGAAPVTQATGLAPQVNGFVSQATGLAPATGGPAVAAPVATGPMLIQARQRVVIQANGGALKATALGETQQAGRLGQTIAVQNVDSKRTVYARVIGPQTVEVDIGGGP